MYVQWCLSELVREAKEVQCHGQAEEKAQSRPPRRQEAASEGLHDRLHEQVRVRRPPTIDGMDADEFIRRNADLIWLHQHGYWEIIHERELAEAQEDAEAPDQNTPDIPF